MLSVTYVNRNMINSIERMPYTFDIDKNVVFSALSEKFFPINCSTNVYWKFGYLTLQDLSKHFLILVLVHSLTF